MAARGKKYTIPLVLLGVTVCSGGAAAYLLKIPPFKQPGEFRESAICQSLGRSTRLIPALSQTLPAESTYKFDDALLEPRVGGNGRYSTSCFVRGQEDLLLSARTEMMREESSESWTRSKVFNNQKDKGGSLEAFGMDVKGLASASKAAILVPCEPAGQIPGGPYSLGIIVDLKKPGTSNDKEIRQSLITLTLSAAQYAHKNAECDLPPTFATAPEREPGQAGPG
ncbi:hypothetical protein [Streptomyces sp. A5-4]|uniref:hypothetical protein n=1 Tax=Streptomyces sp. A5-4 TaxID=3384771 RepID=UPI003DA88BEB